MDSKTIIYKDPSLDKLVETEVINGKCKLQWKVDWAMRWMSFDVDYEMCGKDLTESVDLGSKICRALNKKPPTNLIYEMFLDEKGEKISKSVGNGISVDEWLRYASPESLALYMFQKPKSAKKLHFDVIPKTVDDYLSHYNSYSSLDKNKQYDNPIWHIHSGKPKEFKSEINFNTLTNLVNVSNSNDKKVIWSFINKYDDQINSGKNPEFDRLIDFALNYYEDFILPKKKFLDVDSSNKEVFIDIINVLENEVTEKSSSEDIQTLLYDIGKKHEFENLKDFFKLVYQVMLGQEQGPRLGSFFKLFGLRETIDYIKKLIDNQNLSFIEHDVQDHIEIENKVDYVLHFASAASPKAYTEHPVNTLKAGSIGTLNTLGLAKKHNSEYLLASTSEVYGDPLISPQNEEYWGNVNPNGERSMYDEAKRFAEAAVATYSRSYDIKA